MLTIERLISGGVITNYFCTSACRHCLYNCGPHREKHYLSPEAAGEIFRTVKSLGCSTVHIGGGEPFLRPQELGAVLEAARREGVGIDYVETNCSWFKDAESAEALLAQLRLNGLHTLLVSISPFHNEHIPFARTRGVMQAAARAGVRVFPWVAEFAADLSAFESARPHALSEYEARYGKDYLRGILGRYWIHLGGRALETFRPVLPTKTLEHILREAEADCHRELADTSHFHIDLFGNFIPGLCAGLAIARDDLGKPLSAEKYPILSVLNAEGIRGLLDFAGARIRLCTPTDRLHQQVRSVHGDPFFPGSERLRPLSGACPKRFLRLIIRPRVQAPNGSRPQVRIFFAQTFKVRPKF